MSDVAYEIDQSSDFCSLDGRPERLGHPPFEPKWTTKKSIRIGFLTGRGHQATDIARSLNDGTTGDTIRAVYRYADLEDFGRQRNAIYVPVPLTAYERQVLSKLALARGLMLEEWMRQVVTSAGIPDDLFSAIVPEKA